MTNPWVLFKMATSNAHAVNMWVEVGESGWFPGLSQSVAWMTIRLSSSFLGIWAMKWNTRGAEKDKLTGMGEKDAANEMGCLTCWEERDSRIIWKSTNARKPCGFVRRIRPHNKKSRFHRVMSYYITTYYRFAVSPTNHSTITSYKDLSLPSQSID